MAPGFGEIAERLRRSTVRVFAQRGRSAGSGPPCGDRHAHRGSRRSYKATGDACAPL